MRCPCTIPFLRRPGEHREPPVLRRHEGQGVLLVVDELRGGQVSGAAQVDGVHAGRRVAHDWLGDDHLFDRRLSLAPTYRRPERQQLEALGQDRRAIHRGESGDRVDQVAHLVDHAGLLAPAEEARQAGERRRDRVVRRLCQRLTPALRPARHHQQRRAVPVTAHGDRELGQQRAALGPGNEAVGAQEGAEERGPSGHASVALLHDS